MINKIGLYRDPRKKKPWVVRWFGAYDPATGKHRRYSRSFKVKREAEAFQTLKSMEFKEGYHRDKPDDITLGCFCEDLFKTRKPELKSKTLKVYRESIERLYEYFGQSFLLSNITPRLAAKFIAELQPIKKNKDGKLISNGKPLSNWTRKKILCNCKTIFKTAITWQLLGKNPFNGIKMSKLATTPWHYLKPSQYITLLDVAPTLRRKALYALTYTAGLRLGEALSLTWSESEIDFDTGEVKIENRSGTATMPPFHVKDHEARMVPLPKHTLDILTELHAEAPEGVPYILLDEKRYHLVIAKWQKFQREGRSWENEDMANNTLREFKRHLKWAGIKPDATLSIHTLRKCCCQNWANHLPPNVTRELMGHADISTTMEYYSQVDKDHRKKAARVINRLVSNCDVKYSGSKQNDAKMTPGANLGVK